MTQQIADKFNAALEALVEQVKEDRSVLAAILCGSLSHDKVWAKSDIDLVLVTIDDKKVEAGDVALYADGVNVHAILIPRAQFRKTVEGSIRNSFMHSFLAKGRLLYTHDETIRELCVWLRRDRRARHDRSSSCARRRMRCAPIYKAHKWLLTRGDLDYTALWILYAATPLAQIEVIGRRLLADREVIPQAMELNPAFFKTIYVDLLNGKKTRKNVQEALEAVDDYLAERAPTLVRAGDRSPSRESAKRGRAPRSKTTSSGTSMSSGVTSACEYLADQGLIGKASAPVQLTRKSNIEVQELAFFYLEDRSDGF